MLAKVDKNTTEVELKEDGSYDVIKEEAFCISDDDDDDVVPATVNGTASCSSTNGNGLANEAAKKKPADDDIITLSDDDDEELNRGIMNSLNDSFSPGRHTGLLFKWRGVRQAENIAVSSNIN